MFKKMICYNIRSGFLFNLKITNLRLCSSIDLPDIDLHYYCNNRNINEINDNIKIRKGIGNIDEVLQIYNTLLKTSKTDSSYEDLKRSLYRTILKLPNRTHPAVQKYRDQPYEVKTLNNKKDFCSHKPLEFSEITRLLNLMRTDQLGNTCGHKSYFFMGGLAELEEALIKYTVTTLLKKNFKFVSVPDILPRNILESCGMTVNSDRTQIYSLDPEHHGPDLFLSGTAEMSLAGLLANNVYEYKDLPLKFAAVSRCYRAETSNLIEERGIYRVHQFTKVEMFSVSVPEQSDYMLEYLREIQEELFSQLGFHMRVLDMPPHELGAPAYRKYDIEAWLPGRAVYGEISSCSNCTDYQSRRLHIKYIDENGVTKFAHTLNGTACAIPRTIIAIVETNQDPKGKIYVPDVLQPYMSNTKYITKNKNVPELKLYKIKKQPSYSCVLFIHIK